MAPQGPPPRRPAGLPRVRLARAARPAGHIRPDTAAQNAGLGDDPDTGDLPPWAGLSISRHGQVMSPGRPARPGRRASPSSPAIDDDFGSAGDEDGWRPRRAVAARARKARRKIYTWGGVAIAVAVNRRRRRARPGAHGARAPAR